MKKITLEEAYITPFFEEYCVLDDLVEYKVFTGKNDDNYNYLLDEENRRFKEADKNNVTFIISITFPSAQILKNINDSKKFSELTNNYLYNKVNDYNKKNNTYHSFFGILPFDTPENALNELKRLNSMNPPINRILFNGPTVNNNKYDWLIEEKWNILWEYANNNKTIFYSHPFIAQTYGINLPDNNMEKYIFKFPQIIASQFGFHMNDAIFYLKLYINGHFDKYENIQWIAGHMGETLIWFIWRFDHRTKLYKKNEDIVLKYEKDYKKEYFPKKKLIDIFTTQKNKKNAQIMINTSGWFNDESLKFAIKTVGIENIMFSVDTPYEDLNFALNWFDNLKLSDSKRKKIAYKNANNILKIFPNKKNFKLIK